MTTPASSSNNGTPLQKELHLFKELFGRLIDAFLNRLFDLSPQKAKRRRLYFIVLFLITGFFAILIYYPLKYWVPFLQDIFNALFSTIPYTLNIPGNPFVNIFMYGSAAALDPRTLQYLPILLASFFIALQCAAIYLSDIFELRDVSVARKFVTEVSLTGSDEIIRITQGDILEEHRDSPNFLIGGPGKVVVDIDSVALFEKPDGTPRVIGPTGKEPGGKATLDGFERFRQAIDLRDHFIELRDQNDKSFAVTSRSRDGISITATDVRFMFSVQRDKQLPDDKYPYTFDKKAVERLVYNATSRVTPDLTNPSTFEFSWINNMIGLIRGKLSGFMNERNLTVYLASIGKPEVDKAKQAEEKLVEETEKLVSSAMDGLPQPKVIKDAPEFVPRSDMKNNLFNIFAEEFTKNTSDKGVELHWIGVGTWKTPLDVVPAKHLEAWKLSRDNLAKGKEKAFDDFNKEIMVQETEVLIQEVPVEAYQSATEEHSEHKNAMRAMLKAYQQQLMKARDFINAKAIISPEDKASAEVIQKAIDNITKAFGHVI